MALFGSLIAANRFTSCLLVAAFILFYTAVLFAVVIGVVVLVAGRACATEAEMLLFWGLLSHVAAIVLAILAAAGGSRMVLSVSRAHPVPRQDNVELHDVVEEMALAAGIRPPGVYQIDSDGLNALAVGGRRRAVVAVTRGLCERLDRDELQAVVAHELARIKNGDMALMTLVAGLVGLTALAKGFIRVVAVAIVLIAVAVFVKDLAEVVIMQVLSMLAGQAPPESQTPVGLWLLLASPVVALLLLSLRGTGWLIQLCISRERQFLADVEAARMTRYPEALAGALEKMDGDTTPLVTACPATAHLFTVSPVMAGRRRVSGAWSSHPPIEERIRRLRSIGGAPQ